MASVQVAPTPVAPAILAQQAHEQFNTAWHQAADRTRAEIAKRRNLFAPSVEPTLEELRAAVPLKGDSIRYAKDASGNERLARDRHGFISLPRPTGRKHPHMNKTQQAIKSGAIAAFRELFTSHAEKVQAAAAATGATFDGVPVDDISKIGARATVCASTGIAKDAAHKRRRARNRQKLSRRINFGTAAGNTNVRRYTR